MICATFAAVLLLASGLLLPAATPVAAQPYTVWSATFTADQKTISSTVRIGCDDASTLDNCSTAITNTRFQFEGNEYTVQAVDNFDNSGRKVYVRLSNTLPPGTFVLYTGGNRFTSNQTGSATQHHVFETPGLTWTDNQSVTVRLVAEGSWAPPPGTPMLSAVSNAATETTLRFHLSCVKGGSGAVTDYILEATRKSDPSEEYRLNHILGKACPPLRGIHITMGGFPSRSSATAYEVRAHARNRLGLMGVWSNTVEVSTTANSMQISGGGNSDPDPEDELTASFEQVPTEHDGKRKFSFLVRLSETIGNFSKSPRASSFEVTRGQVRSVEQAAAGLWRVAVKPNSRRQVGITLAGGKDCDDPGAVCTPDIRPLANTSTATIPGPLGLKVAGGRAREADGAAIDFAVTLNRAAASTVTVDYATEDETATAGADYESASGTLTFAPGETAKTVRVTILADLIDEKREIFRLKLSNAVGAQIRDGKAAGRILNANPNPNQDAAPAGMAITYTLSGPADNNLIEGESYEITATASYAVPTDTMVEIETDYTVEPIRIEAGETTGTTTLTVPEGGLTDGTDPGERLVLFGSVDGMEIGELSFTIWDAAVPALPVGGVLLLAALLAWRGAVHARTAPPARRWTESR